MTPDTSAEAVERRIRELHEAGFDNAAATLRALAAERDTALAVRDEAVIDDLSAFLAGLTAEERRILAGLRDGSLVAVPAEPDEIITDAIREAWRNTRVGGVCGMSLEAQWRNGFAREIAAYRAMLAAAQEAPR